MVVGPGWGLPSAFGFGVVVVLDDVVDIATPGGSGAPREHTRPVAENDLLADPVGSLVRRCRELGLQVDDGLDGHLRPRVAAPGLDLVEQDQSLTFFDPTGGTKDRLLADGGGVDVSVDDDLPRSPADRPGPWSRCGPG